MRRSAARALRSGGGSSGTAERARRAHLRSGSRPLRPLHAHCVPRAGVEPVPTAADGDVTVRGYQPTSSAPVSEVQLVRLPRGQPIPAERHCLAARHGARVGAVLREEPHAPHAALGQLGLLAC